MHNFFRSQKFRFLDHVFRFVKDLKFSKNIKPGPKTKNVFLVFLEQVFKIKDILLDPK